jgi:hypothetical protein
LGAALQTCQFQRREHNQATGENQKGVHYKISICLGVEIGAELGAIAGTLRVTRHI